MCPRSQAYRPSVGTEVGANHSLHRWNENRLLLNAAKPSSSTAQTPDACPQARPRFAMTTVATERNASLHNILKRKNKSSSSCPRPYTFQKKKQKQNPSSLHPKVSRNARSQLVSHGPSCPRQRESRRGSQTRTGRASPVPLGEYPPQAPYDLHHRYFSRPCCAPLPPLPLPQSHRPEP